jgi:hypothetical protein
VNRRFPDLGDFVFVRVTDLVVYFGIPAKAMGTTLTRIRPSPSAATVIVVALFSIKGMSSMNMDFPFLTA